MRNSESRSNRIFRDLEKKIQLEKEQTLARRGAPLREGHTKSKQLSKI